MGQFNQGSHAFQHGSGLYLPSHLSSPTTITLSYSAQTSTSLRSSTVSSSSTHGCPLTPTDASTFHPLMTALHQITSSRFACLSTRPPPSVITAASLSQPCLSLSSMKPSSAGKHLTLTLDAMFMFEFSGRIPKPRMSSSPASLTLCASSPLTQKLNTDLPPLPVGLFNTSAPNCQRF